jgi:hypothetical protein
VRCPESLTPRRTGLRYERGTASYRIARGDHTAGPRLVFWTSAAPWVALPFGAKGMVTGISRAPKKPKLKISVNMAKSWRYNPFSLKGHASGVVRFSDRARNRPFHSEADEQTFGKDGERQ